MYPFYEKAQKSGINTICIHKGLMPRDYEKAFAGTWESATVNDLGQAAKDWAGYELRYLSCGAAPVVSG